jgi:hypothetical protein
VLEAALFFPTVARVGDIRLFRAENERAMNVRIQIRKALYKRESTVSNLQLEKIVNKFYF